MLQFPDSKFIIWTPTAQVERKTNKEEAERANEFSEWVKTEWDVKEIIFIYGISVNYKLKEVYTSKMSMRIVQMIHTQMKDFLIV